MRSPMDKWRKPRAVKHWTDDEKRYAIDAISAGVPPDYICVFLDVSMKRLYNMLHRHGVSTAGIRV